MMKLFTKKSLLGVRGGKGKTSTVQTANVQTIKTPVIRLTTKGLVMDSPFTPECPCSRSVVSLLGVRGGKGNTTNLPKTASTQQNVVDKMINSALSPLLKRPFDNVVTPECPCK